MYFSKVQDWFEVDKINSHLYVIRERLDLLDNRYYTKYTNLYLLVGNHSALLIDTGSGIGNLTDTVGPLIGDRDLIVVNSHNHFDHVGGNHEFDETMIHRLDFKKLMSPMDVSYLKSSDSKFAAMYEETDYKIHFSETNIPLIGNELFDLGGIEVQTIFTTGHTPGSVCFLSSNDDLFTGDTINYGGLFLPGRDNYHYYLKSLEELSRLYAESSVSIYPGHEDYQLSPGIIPNLIDKLLKLDEMNREYDTFLNSWIYRSDQFTIVQPNE